MAEPEIKIFDRLPNAYKSGGALLAESDAPEKNIVFDIIKQIGQNLAGGGKDLINVTLPVTICEPRSYLQRLADGWCYAPIFLNKAVDATDPVERLKFVITFALSGLSNTCRQRKPFNPILGETYQATYEDGSEVYAEQSSHHPPISNWLIIGPQSKYRFYGYGEWCASFRANSVKGHQKGPHVVEFQDGTKIVYNLPEVWVKGMILGDRVIEYEGCMTFKDEKNNLIAEVVIPIPSNSSFFSAWFGGAAKPPSDHFAGSIRSLSSDDTNEVVSKILGSWLGCVEFDGVKYWDFLQDLPKIDPVPKPDPLPSDCRNRQDLIHLSQSDFDQAQTWKTKLENIQRRDAKLRKEAAARRKELNVTEVKE